MPSIDFSVLSNTTKKLIDVFAVDKKTADNYAKITDLSLLSIKTYYTFSILSELSKNIKSILEQYENLEDVSFDKDFNNDIEDLFSNSENITSVSKRDQWYENFIKKFNVLINKWKSKINYLKVLYVIVFHIVPTFITYYGFLFVKPTEINYIDNDKTYNYTIDVNQYVEVYEETENHYCFNYYNTDVKRFCQASTPKENLKKSNASIEDIVIVVKDCFIKDIPQADANILYKLDAGDIIVSIDDIPYYYEVQFYNGVVGEIEYGYVAKKNVKSYLTELQHSSKNVESLE